MRTLPALNIRSRGDRVCARLCHHIIALMSGGDPSDILMFGDDRADNESGRLVRAAGTIV